MRIPILTVPPSIILKFADQVAEQVHSVVKFNCHALRILATDNLILEIDERLRKLGAEKEIATKAAFDVIHKANADYERKYQALVTEFVDRLKKGNAE